MLFTPDGSWVHKAHVVLTKDDVLAFVDGRVLLERLGRLGSLRVGAACTRCGAEPRAVVLPDVREVDVSCDCRAGRVKTDRELDVEPLLLALGWRLTCSSCGEQVRGDNDPRATAYAVHCPCTDRVYTRAVA